MMWKSPALSSLAGRLTRAGMARAESLNHCYSSMAPSHIPTRSTAKTAPTVEDQCGHQATLLNSDKNAGVMKKHQIGKNVSRKDRIDFLLKTLLNLKDSKEAVYGALDAWVAWEQDFPLVSLRRALIALEKEQQWHRVIQVIKWMLSKGQGKTMGTYGQLIQALDKDHRAEEAHVFWQKRIGLDLHSVPWQLCNLMIGVYYRNNMLEHLVKLFKCLEAFDRKPPERSTVQRVADAYEMLGMPEERERLVLKFADLFSESAKDPSKKSRRASSVKKKKSGRKNQTPTPDFSADDSRYAAVGMDSVRD
uniref:Pentatricopeptide repeat-containing protein At4g18975ic-like n=1 Tax=Rhizophora mucronata TaxID=61149 RepID=A0A2P2K0F4_RHIMU